METSAQLIESFFLGGITTTKTVYDLVNGWNSDLISKLQFDPKNIDGFNSHWFKTGDTIVYDKKIMPLLQSSYSLGSALNTKYTINNGGDNDAANTGKITAINGLDYPNVMTTVFTG